MTPEQKERLATIQEGINHALDARIQAQKMVDSAIIGTREHQG